MKRSLSLPISIFLAFSFSCLSLSLSLLILFSSRPFSFSFLSPNPSPCLRIYVADLPRAFNYGLLEQFWSLSAPDSRLPDPQPESNPSPNSNSKSNEYPPYPENPLIRQYSAEYWLLGDLEARRDARSRRSVAIRVYKPDQADVIFVPFFAALSAEMQLGWGNKGDFLKKDERVNLDYKRQKEVLEIVKGSEAWKKSGGRDHVFVLTDPVAMWHVKDEIAHAILLVVDFNGWYKIDSQFTNNHTSPPRIEHGQVSFTKDVIVPYTHLLPTLHISDDKNTRSTLLYFKGAKHRHRGGLVREKLWEILQNERGVIMEEGFPNSTGKAQSIKGMRSSQFCLSPAGDTPTSCRLFDSIASLCIPVIVSDNVALPFEGPLNYSDFALSVSEGEALQPGWLVEYLRGVSGREIERLRGNLAKVQKVFEFENGFEGGVGPALENGAVEHIWKMVQRRVLMVEEAVMRETRRPKGVEVPLRGHYTR